MTALWLFVDTGKHAPGCAPPSNAAAVVLQRKATPSKVIGAHAK